MRAARAALIVSMVLLGLGVGPAAAHGGEPEVLLDRTTGEPGDSVAIQVSGLAPGTEVELRLVSDADGGAISLGAGTVPASSDLDVQATIPPSVAPGAYVVEATGAGLVLTADLAIVAVGSPPEDEPDGRDEEDPLLAPLPSGWSRGNTGPGAAPRDPSPAPTTGAPFGAPVTAWIPVTLLLGLTLAIAAGVVVRRGG